ncbi:MAG: LLM class flavin-dependent oxidoreductase [bacterium]|nr:LLM class flavin-dependent oxidoreductase [bacterium]
MQLPPPSLGVAYFSLGNRGPTQLADLSSDLEGIGIDHLFVTESNNDAMTTMAVIAGATSTATIGSAIANIYLRHPLQMAQAAASVEEVSGGRLLLGLGVGHQMVNEEGLGLDMSTPVRDMREYVEVIRAGLTSGGASLGYEGSRYRVLGPRATVAWTPERRVPIVVAAHGPNMVRMAVEVADGIFTSVVSRAQISRLRELMDDHCAAIGRDPATPRIYTMVYACIDDDQRLALERLRDRVELTLVQINYVRQLRREGMLDERSSLDDRQVAELGIAGSVEHARHILGEYRRAGVDVPIIAPFTPDPADIATGYRSFSVDAYMALAELVGY